MFKFEFSGLDDLQRELEQLAENARELDGEHEIPFDNLFTQAFMQAHTPYDSIDALLEAGGFHAEGNDEFEAIPEDMLDAYIAKATDFESWEEMLSEATQEYVTDQLGF